MTEEKIKIAFIKFGGMASGGTEKFLQTVAANLPKTLKNPKNSELLDGGISVAKKDLDKA